MTLRFLLCFKQTAASLAVSPITPPLLPNRRGRDLVPVLSGVEETSCDKVRASIRRAERTHQAILEAARMHNSSKMANSLMIRTIVIGGSRVVGSATLEPS